MKTEFVHKSGIEAGDCIVVNGEMQTVCHSDIRNGFMGLTIFGESFGGSNGKVERCLFPKWNCGEVVGFRTQI